MSLDKDARTSDRTTRMTFLAEIERRIVRSAVGIKEINNSGIWKSRPLPKKKMTLSPALTAGERWAWGHRQLSEVLPSKRNRIGTFDAKTATV
jgi:hypothetical protein